MSVLRLTFVLAIGGCTPHAREPDGEPEPARAPPRPEPEPEPEPAAQPEPEPEPAPVEPEHRGKTRGHLSRAWPEPAPDDPAFSCTRDEQCKLVAMDACDACNDGWELSVREDHVAAIKAEYDAPEQAWCTLVWCSHESTPICDHGVCALRSVRKDYVDDIPRPHKRRRAPHPPPILRNRVPPG